MSRYQKAWPLALLSLLLLGRADAQEAVPLSPREQALQERIDQLEKRLAALEARTSPPPAVPLTAATLTPAPVPSADSPSLPGFLPGTTLNFNFDGYYGFNFNHPADRTNQLRANDVLSNNFTLNQADVIVERLPDPAAGRRLGYRFDLMFGQNTQTLQGSSQNEPRPDVYRHIFQAFGTYVAPVGSGVTIDFGKFASALGYETNYAKDQINYSRSYYFNFLPFYHMGFRGGYNFNDKLSFQYWLVNGANQTEDFNAFKSNAFLFTIKPTKTISWNVNYYVGQESPALLTASGANVLPVPNGREHIFDTYIQWTPSSKLTLAAEADSVINRFLPHSPPSRVTGGVGYLKYQLTPRFALADRFEYLADRAGLFSGTVQDLKEDTVTLTFQPSDGFQVRTEFRRDFSNRPYFLTNTPGVPQRYMNTATLAMLWWFGGKQGAW